jgi:ADP-ribose pyrophosphatase
LSVAPPDAFEEHGGPAAADGRDPHLVEQTVESSSVYQGHFLHVRRDRVRLPDAREAYREYIVHPGAVVIVPILDDGRLIVERQYRHPMGRVMLEFPAGKLTPGEAPLACACRELEEETGFKGAQWARAGVLHNAIAYSDEFIEIWFARGLSPGERRLDDGEFLDVEFTTAETLDALASGGTLTDAKSLIALMWLQNWRAGRWDVSWVEPG